MAQFCYLGETFEDHSGLVPSPVSPSSSLADRRVGGRARAEHSSGAIHDEEKRWSGAGACPVPSECHAWWHKLQCTVQGTAWYRREQQSPAPVSTAHTTATLHGLPISQATCGSPARSYYGRMKHLYFPCFFFLHFHLRVFFTYSSSLTSTFRPSSIPSSPATASRPQILAGSTCHPITSLFL